jgi:hypothetical protein
VTAPPTITTSWRGIWGQEKGRAGGIVQVALK